MTSDAKVLGVLTPVGGGDPIPLTKTEFLIGRRPSCDISLDYHNVSGKHCNLRLINGVWHVRDLGSTNGTTVNGSQIARDHPIMPEDEVGIATHLFTIEYEPSGPTGVLNKESLIEDGLAEARKRPSLMELAGLAEDEDGPRGQSRPTRPPERIERPSTDEADFDDAVPDNFQNAPAPNLETSDDDFLKLFEE